MTHFVPGPFSADDLDSPANLYPDDIYSPDNLHSPDDTSSITAEGLR